MVKSSKSDVGASSGVKRPTAPYLLYTVDRIKELKGLGKLDKVNKETRAKLKHEFDALPVEAKVSYVEKFKKKSEDYRASNPTTPQKRDGIQTRIQISRVHSIIGRLNQDQVTAVREIGFGGILDVKCTELERGLCQFLAQSYDVDHHCLNVHGKTLSCSSSDVEEILGIKDSGDEVVVGRATRETVVVDFPGNGSINLKNLSDSLLELDSHDTEFKVRFALFILGAFLCPTTQTSISRNYLNVIHPEKISTYNWAKYVFDFLEKGIKKMKKNKSQSPTGCLLLLLIKYFEHIGGPVHKEVVPRIGAWGDKEIKERMGYLKSVGGFLSPEVQIDLKEHPPLHSVVAVADEVSKQVLPPIERQLAEVNDNIGEVKEQLTVVKEQIVESHRQIVDSIPRFDELVSKVTTDVTQLLSKLLVNRPSGSSPPSLGYSPDTSFSPPRSPERPSPIHFEPPLAPSPPIPANVAQTTPLFRVPKKTEDHAQPSHSSNIAARVKRHQGRRPSSHLISPYVGDFGKKRKIDADSLGKVLQISDEGQQGGVQEKGWERNFSCPYPMQQIDVIHQYVHHAGADLDEQLVEARDMGFWLTRRDILDSMEEGKWLTDVVISTLAALLTAETKAKLSSLAPTEPLSLYLSCYISMELMGTPNQPDRFLRKNSKYIYSLNRCNKIFIPMNVDSQHWYLAVIHIIDRKVVILDSLRAGKRADTKRRAQVKHVVTQLAKLLGDDFREVGNFDVCHAEWVPKQPNGSDCGIFVMKLMCEEMTEENAQQQVLAYDSGIQRKAMLARLIQSTANTRFECIYSIVERWIDKT